MEKNTANLQGGLLINKPAGVTSFDIIRILRQEVGQYKWGHSGTLDPFATGLLIILVGHATRLQQELHILPKTYKAEVTLGATSDTDDGTGKIRPGTFLLLKPSHNQILAALDQIKHQTTQIPPSYSAIKINGKKMYEYARVGESVERKPRLITIYDIGLDYYEYPVIKISVTCSTGTYIRSIARNIGEILGTGAYCSALERTAIGPFALKKAFVPEELLKVIHRAIVPMELLVSHLSQLICSSESVAKYKQGKAGECEENIPINTSIALLDVNKKLFGIAIRETDATILNPKKIFL